ncbi:hypothetical protein [Polynucleobacter sp. AP-Nickl1-40-C4]|uniref:hypothetical protein n=1 Tax=Polynucleobacter sp. AP-Nickl1-40-C4 TaxID=3108275 RepID=UPI002B23526C|nr:hypothetical protein [Polynucleobacter sp. AP-Nickl1-40-C4]MEA9569030.1 hypothetical protein [Polynucleobacter sp. AP-Nickl1-40-C4]
MVLSKKTLIIGLCLLLIAFRAAAGNIFIQSAVERVHLQVNSCSSLGAEHALTQQDSTDDKQPVSAMYVMYHVTANVSDTQILIPAQAESVIAYGMRGDRLYFDNIPDSAFKPPKHTL